MTRNVVRPGPTRLERAAILLGCHLLTLAGLLAWTLGAPAPEPQAIATTTAVVAPARASVMTVGTGYVVKRSVD